MQPNVTIDGPQAAVCAVPYVLGFQPASSVVMLWMADDRLVLAQRVDLPPKAPVQWARELCSSAQPSGGTDAVMIVVCPRGRGDELPGRALVDLVAGELASIGARLRDAVLADGERWWSYLCEDSACCPPQGRGVEESTRLRISAAFAMAGVAPLGSRDALVAEMAAPEEALPEVLAEALPRALLERVRAPRELWRDAVIERLLAVLADPPREASGPELAEVLVGLGDIRVRDSLLWHMAHWRAEQLHGARVLLAEACRHAPAGLVAPAATCCAVVAWTLGDGARAAIALDRALADDPDYPLGVLVARAVRSGLPPGVWLETMGQLTDEQCRAGLGEARAS